MEKARIDSVRGAASGVPAAMSRYEYRVAPILLPSFKPGFRRLIREVDIDSAGESLALI